MVRSASASPSPRCNRKSNSSRQVMLVVAALVSVICVPLSSSSSASTAFADACQVTINDIDVTSEFFVQYQPEEHEHDDDNSSAQQQQVPRPPPDYVVDCIGSRKCQNAVIENCPVVKCHEGEACYNATITNVTHSVECIGVHACHRTKIYFSDKDVNPEEAEQGQEESHHQHQSVQCDGRSSCDVTHIEGRDVDVVSCKGPKGCRKVSISINQGTVKCHEGHHNFEACDNFATIDAGCLYCGHEGCASKINQCRYKITGTSMDRYDKCQPESVIGHCSAHLKEELAFELAAAKSELGGDER